MPVSDPRPTNPLRPVPGGHPDDERAPGGHPDDERAPGGHPDDERAPGGHAGDDAPTVRVAGEPRFELRGRIGAGNHGVVFRAQDRHLQREVAIKRFSHFLADDPRAMRRITREVATLARVSHPNVVTVHDLVHLPDGDGEITPHLVMELVEGTSLRDLLASHGPSPRSVIAARGVLEGLAACHRADILHLDIKPANVLVTGEGAVKIVDFGIARAASDATATVAGTPHYMAPEQYDGRADQRSDIYSVGCLLYECLTGRPPFEGTMASQLLAHRTRPRPDPREHAPYVSAGLAGIVMRAMAIDPSQRYASVGQMLDALSSVQIEPVAQTRPAPGPRPAPAPAIAPDPRPAPASPTAEAGSAPVVTRWSRLQRLGAGLGLSAFLVALIPGLVWSTTSIPPAPEYLPGLMIDPQPWWLLAVGIAVLFLALRWQQFSGRLAGPPVGWARPGRLLDRDARAAIRQAAGGALRGSLPMLVPWYALLVVALAAGLDLDRPHDLYASSWTVAWLCMPLAVVALTWRAVTRVRLRVGRILMSVVLLAGAGLAGVLFVVYPSVAGGF
ncbi:protein kinase [Aeromicrobium sp. CTD01-1L150]|uniref:serine/threonine-protein kinase n=1 Tax=Aeromicrobium sp. CTD01-1L150 TaxID=3341830 RepID=UPI0035BFF01F